MKLELARIPFVSPYTLSVKMADTHIRLVFYFLNGPLSENPLSSTTFEHNVCEF